jgi:PAS domain S-box-containing protein
MNDERKTKAQLIAELGEARQRVLELEAAETARQQLDRALRDSETRYRRLFETAQDGILLLDATTGQIVDVNPFLIAWLGYSHADFVGKHLWEIGPFKDVAESKLAFEQLQTNEYIRYEDLPLETRDGQRIEVEFVSNVYRINGDKVIQCNVRDITERYGANQEINSLARFPAENPNPVLRVGADGVLLYANAASAAILQDLGCAVGTRVPAFWQIASAGAFAEQANRHLDVQVADRVWSLFIAPITEAGYINLYGQDITDRQRAESQREAALEALRESEELFRQVYEYMEVGVARMESDHGDLYVSIVRDITERQHAAEQLRRTVFPSHHQCVGGAPVRAG